MCRVYTHIDLPMKTKKEIHDKTIRLIPLSVAIPLNILVLVLLLSFIGNTVVYLGNKTRFANDYKVYKTIHILSRTIINITCITNITFI